MLIMAMPVVGLILYSMWGDNVEKDRLKKQTTVFKERKSSRMRSEDTIAKMGKGEKVSLDVLERICNYFNCDIGDVMSFEK